MKNNKILIAIVIVILITIVTITGVITSNLINKAAEPASASGIYIQKTTTEEEPCTGCVN